MESQFCSSGSSSILLPFLIQCVSLVGFYLSVDSIWVASVSINVCVLDVFSGTTLTPIPYFFLRKEKIRYGCKVWVWVKSASKYFSSSTELGGKGLQKELPRMFLSF
jgi:hypothetical protein